MTLWPSRMTRARGAVIERSAITARSARCSWKNPMTALTITIAPIATASSHFAERRGQHAGATSSSQMTGLANWRASSVRGVVACSRRISFGPNSASRRCASADERPDDWASERCARPTCGTG